MRHRNRGHVGIGLPLVVMAIILAMLFGGMLLTETEITGVQDSPNVEHVEFDSDAQGTELVVSLSDAATANTTSLVVLDETGASVKTVEVAPRETTVRFGQSVAKGEYTLVLVNDGEGYDTVEFTVDHVYV